MPERIFDRRLQCVIVLVIGLLLTDAGIAYHNIKKLYAGSEQVTHTHKVIETLQAIDGSLTDAETAQRGFIITGDRQYLNLYNAAIPAIDKSLNEFGTLTVDNSLQQTRLPTLREAVNIRLKMLHENLSLRSDKTPAVAKKSAVLNRGKEQMDKIRLQIAEMAATEIRLLEERSKRSEKSFYAALWSGLVSNAICLLALAGLLVAIRSHLVARQRYTDTLHDERELFRITLASIGDAVVTTDTFGRVTYLNPIAQSLTGWTNVDALGQPLDKIFNIVNERTNKKVDNPVDKVLHEGVLVGLANHTVLIAKDGARRPIDDSAAPIKDTHGHIKGVVLIFRDVSDARRSQEELKINESRFRHMAEELSESNRELEQFAYVASHDLQEPLHVIGSFCDLLARRCEQKLESKEKEYIGFIKQAAGQARTLVKELLEYSRIGKESPAQDIDLTQVIEEVRSNLRVTIERSQAEIVAECDLPRLHASHLEILQLFQNLISNAVKYAKPDVPPKIRIACSKLDGMYLFHVKDNGMGIEPEHKDRIFEMFQRVHSNNNGSSGTGIGLAICKKIVEQYGGRIWVESEAGKGSTFYFTLKTA
jgi:PAS domain S-box-containing protein